MTESTPPTDAAGDDVAARVLAAAKSLRDGFEERFSAIASKVKKQSEGPVKIIEMDDEIPVVMQLSVWDSKMGPVPAMLVGESRFLATITPQELEDTTRMIDVLATGGTCDLSKGGVNRILLKCAVADPSARGGETWLLLAAYYDPGIGVPKAIVEELLKELAVHLHPEAAMAVEAKSIREAYNPASSKWRELLQEMRQSIWVLVQKAGEIAPPAIPGIDPVEAKRLDEEVKSNIKRARGHDVPKPKKAMSDKEAVKAWFMSAYGKLRLAERVKHAAASVPAKVQASKAIVVPPVAEVVSGPPAGSLHVVPNRLSIPAVPSEPAVVQGEAPAMASQVAPGYPTAPPHLMASLPAAPARDPDPDPAPAPAPLGIDTTSDNTDTAFPNEVDPDQDADPLAGLESGSGAEPVPVQITVNKPMHGVTVTPKQPTESPASPKRLAAIEAGLIEVLGKLQRSGYSLKVNKDTGEATACKLVELDPGKGGLLALFLSFHARFLPHAILHEIDGRFFAGDERLATVPYRPSMRVAIASHLQGAEDIVYRGKSIGKVYKGRPLKPVIVPLVLVRSAIKGTGADVPFKWVEPAPQDGIEHGHFVIAAPDIDRAETFIMNSVRVLGPRLVAGEAQHVEATEADLVKSSRTGWGAALVACALAGVGLLASAHLLPVDATIAILQYWYVLAGAIVLVLVAAGNLYQKLDQRVNRAIDARLHEVTSRTPLLVKPGWEVLIEAARRIGKADFGEFKAAFCQELDPLAVDETVEVVWQQDAGRAGPAPKEALGALDALAKAAKKPKAMPKAAAPVANEIPFTPGLKVTESASPAKRKKPVDDDILSQPDEEEPAAVDEAPEDLHFDPLAALKEDR